MSINWAVDRINRSAWYEGLATLPGKSLSFWKKLQILLSLRKNDSWKSTGNRTCWSVRHPVVGCCTWIGYHSWNVVAVTGGTSVTGALECPSSEKRMIVSLDTSQMVSVLISHIISCTFSVSEMIYYVSNGMLNPTHSLTYILCREIYLKHSIISAAEPLSWWHF